MEFWKINYKFNISDFLANFDDFKSLADFSRFQLADFRFFMLFFHLCPKLQYGAFFPFSFSPWIGFWSQNLEMCKYKIILLFLNMKNSEIPSKISKTI